jgi:hypothetical protein
MSSISKQLIINKFVLPREILDIVKEYLFHKKIPKNDKRYDLLLTIPIREHFDKFSCVYLSITDDKDYYLVYINYAIQIQTLRYGNGNNGHNEGVVYFIDGNIFVMK